MFSIKALATAAAVSASVIFAMPIGSQAMTASVKVHNSANINFKNKSNSWIARHCAISNDIKCRRLHITRRKHHGPYYGQYRLHHKAGVTFKMY